MNVLENFLVSKLFRSDDQLVEVAFQKGVDINISKFAAGKPLKYEKLTCTGQLKQEIFGPCPCKCITLKKHEKNFELGRKKFQKEIDIVRTIKRLRKFRRTNALMLVYSPEQKQLIQNSTMKVLKFN